MMGREKLMIQHIHFICQTEIQVLEPDSLDRCNQDEHASEIVALTNLNVFAITLVDFLYFRSIFVSIIVPLFTSIETVSLLNSYC